MNRVAVIAYTDGACKGNPGPGGWSAILVRQDGEQEICGGSPATTNNRMELTAVIEVMKSCDVPSDITIVTDSTYVMISKEKWQRWSKKPNLPNKDLWLQLIEVGRKGNHHLHFQHVDGHSGHVYNERCDTIAKMQASKIAVQRQVFPSLTDIASVLEERTAER